MVMIKRLRVAMSHLGVWIVALCFAVWLFFFVMLLEILLLSVCWLVVRFFHYCLCVGWWLGSCCCWCEMVDG